MGRSKGKLHAQHQAVYRERRKLGLTPVVKPWDYLCSAEVKEMAWKAYRVASFQISESLMELDGAHYTQQEWRERFAEMLAESFKDALTAHAVAEGGCWPVDADTPPYRNYPRVWEMLSNDTPTSWRPEYPLYTKVTPASTRNASGAVINADEGNANAHDLTA